MAAVNNLCPVCKMSGNLVSNITVKHLVLDELKDKTGSVDYHLCMNEECEVVYYQNELNIKFDKEQIKVPIWFKKDANPKYVCYCNKVTEELAIKHRFASSPTIRVDDRDIQVDVKESLCESCMRIIRKRQVSPVAVPENKTALVVK